MHFGLFSQDELHWVDDDGSQPTVHDVPEEFEMSAGADQSEGQWTTKSAIITEENLTSLLEMVPLRCPTCSRRGISSVTRVSMTFNVRWVIKRVIFVSSTDYSVPTYGILLNDVMYKKILNKRLALFLASITSVIFCGLAPFPTHWSQTREIRVECFATSMITSL